MEYLEPVFWIAIWLASVLIGLIIVLLAGEAAMKRFNHWRWLRKIRRHYDRKFKEEVLR